VSKLINNFASGGDGVIHATSDYNLLAVYAVKRAGGDLSLLVINKSPAANLNAGINLAGFTPQSTLKVYSYSVAQDEAARTGAGSPDVAFNSFAGAATAFSYTFPAYSATVLALSPTSACSPQVSPVEQFFEAAGGQASVSVTSNAGCAWNATSNTDWITINSGASGNGSGAVTYTVANNSTGVARQGTLAVAGRAFTVLQDGGASSDCAYTIAPTSKTFKPAGGGASVSVTAGPRCAWQATSNAGWITITSGVMGIGNGSVSYTVAPNSSSARKGTITIAGKTFAVKQKGG
jgi:Viral BACON domain/Putative binding domain, N-terminal